MNKRQAKKLKKKQKIQYLQGKCVPVNREYRQLDIRNLFYKRNVQVIITDPKGELLNNEEAINELLQMGYKISEHKIQ